MKSVFLCCLAIFGGVVYGQTTSQFVGTVTAMRPDAAEIVVKPDKGDAVAVKVSAATVAQRIAPGERDLKNAAVIAASDVALGDRVLITLGPGTADLRRIVVMSAAEITRRDEADRLDWIKRGVSGIVRERKGDTITLGIKGSEGESTFAVRIVPSTSFRRYGPDTVRFADARKSSADEIETGDQVRTRGQNRTATGLVADDIVFGTFQTHVGKVVSVDVAARRLEVKEQGSTKTLLVSLTPDTQVKGMPDFGATMGGAPDRGGPPAGPPGSMPPGSGMPGRMPGGVPGGGAPDVGQMVEQMPGSGLDAARPGQTVIVSSTKGAKPDEVTAITMVVNADMLIRMVTASSGRGGSGRGASQGLDIGGQGMSMGSMGFDLSGITP